MERVTQLQYGTHDCRFIKTFLEFSQGLYRSLVSCVYIAIVSHFEN